MNPAKVVRIAKARGLDAIAITDHNRIDGAYEARRAAADAHILVVKWNLYRGHLDCVVSGMVGILI